jgi:hypothetical protein
MSAFIIVALAAILLILIVWRWLVLQRQSRQDGEPFAGRSTISELFSKDKRRKRKLE